jgi:Na+-driven multidrug efflux pump
MRVKNPFQFKLEKSILTPVIIMSIPIFIENLVFQAGKMITQTFAVPFGTNDLAVNGIVNSIHMLMIVTGMTAAASVTPVVGRYIGMRRYDEARAKLRQFQILCTGFAVLSAALIYFLIPPLARFYSPIASVQKQIILVAGTGCLMYPLFWPASFVTPAGLRGAGDMRFTTYVALASMLAVRICLGYFTAVVLKMSVLGIWIGMYADWLVRGAFYLWRQRGDKWLRKSLI